MKVFRIWTFKLAISPMHSHKVCGASTQTLQSEKSAHQSDFSLFFLIKGGEAFFCDPVDQLRTAFRHDLSARQDVDCVNVEGGEDRRVVGYDQERIAALWVMIRREADLSA